MHEALNMVSHQEFLLTVSFQAIKFFQNFILADEPFAKALRIFGTCVLVNKNLCGKLVLSLELPIKFDEKFKITSVPFFITDFNLLSCELDNFTFKVLHRVTLYKTK